MSAAETIRFICAGCGYRARIPASFNGKVILCPGCQQVQIASSDGGTPTGDTVSVSRVKTASPKELTGGQVSVPDATGKIRFTCSKCGFHGKLAASYAGKAIACPGCQAPQLIPPLAAASSAAAPAVAAAAPQATADIPSNTPTVGAPVLSDEPGISFDDPVSSSAAEQSEDEPAPPPPAAAAPSAPAASAPSPIKPAAKPSRPSSPPRVGGVVRRGVKEPAPPAQDNDADLPEESDDDDDAQAKSPPGFLKPVLPLLERLKDPKILSITIACVAAFILEICLIVSWRGAVGEAAKYRSELERTQASLKDATADLKKTEYERDEQTSKLKADGEQLKKAQDDLAAAQKAAQEATEQYKAAEAERAKGYEERRQALAQYDDTFAKLKKSELAREEDYKKRLEAEKARDEEARLRKELKSKLDDLAKAQK